MDTLFTLATVATNVDTGDAAHFTDEIRVVVCIHDDHHDVGGYPFYVVLVTWSRVMSQLGVGEKGEGDGKQCRIIMSLCNNAV